MIDMRSETTERPGPIGVIRKNLLPKSLDLDMIPARFSSRHTYRYCHCKRQLSKGLVKVDTKSSVCRNGLMARI